MQKTATSFKRRCARLLLCLVGLAPLLWIGTAWLAAREITQPSRRPLQDYHQVILGAPASHGIIIAPFNLSDGTPTLLCRPDPNGTLDQRGTLLRSQLQQRNLTLPTIGIENGATLVLLHGRRGRKEDLLPIAVRYCSVGFRCLLIDLPAHGENPAQVATFGPNESPLPLKALTEASSKFNFPARPAGLWGMSMGGCVAIHATASTQSHWDALIIVASFDTLSPVIHRQCAQLLGSPLASPFHSTLQTFFHRQTGIPLAQIQPASLAPQIHLPILIAHGDDDPLIPLSSARQLFDAIGTSDKSFVNVGSGTHGNVLVTSYPLYADMTTWFLNHLTH